jgi:hypothetical protein
MHLHVVVETVINAQTKIIRGSESRKKERKKLFRRTIDLSLRCTDRHEKRFAEYFEEPNVIELRDVKPV